MNTQPSNFEPTASWQVLRLRSELLARLRAFFDRRGFLEVETPLLSSDIVVDRHLEPLPVMLPEGSIPDGPRRLWLQTSPEAAMKRLMAAGGVAIYQVCRSFRGAERGRLHNPEFTLVEWYRRGDTMQLGMDLLDELCQSLLGRGAAQRTSYGEAFVRHTGVDPHRADAGDLAAAAALRSLSAPPGFEAADRESWLQFLLAEWVEPQLGRQRPEILYDYPASQAVLAKVRRDDPPFAERFELYVEGIELANGFCELTDADELRTREETENAARRREGKAELPGAPRLLSAMQSGLPPCAGCALGFDRVVMLAAGAASLDEVLAFPAERA